MTMVAALYVAKDGSYSGLPGVDPWDEERDARRYDGPWPVVAHPPCQRWGKMWFGQPLTVKRTGQRKRKGDDGGCFAAALAAVRKWGGVLEHPENSHAWAHFGLNKPPREGRWITADFEGGWTCCVEQGRYGHYARKPTWLYAVGCDLPELEWGKSEPKLDPAVVEQLGADDDRWLIDRVLGVVDCLRPGRFFRENVPGNADGQLAALVPPLEAMGYRIAAGIFAAAEAGASHRRERLFIMADRENGDGGLQLQPWRSYETSFEFGRCGKNMAVASRAGSQGLTTTGCAGQDDGNAGRGGGAEIPLFAPGPSDPIWREILEIAPQLEPAVCRVADGVAGRVDRLRACGNGVFSLAAAYAWRTLDALLAADLGDGSAGEFVLNETVSR